MPRVKIDNENIFLEALKTGINLFTGAGFSILESPSGNKLPKASELCDEIIKRFKVDSSYAGDLEKISTILKRNSKTEFYEFLRQKYTISPLDYNSLYNALKLIRIKSIITTNIDNIIPSVFDSSDLKHLVSVSRFGPIKNEETGIKYIPLHGDITDHDQDLYFGKFELCNVSNQNIGLFSMMESELMSSPTLFWGYGFHDGSVNAVISRVLESSTQNIWILLRKEDDASFYRELGCHVIIADTKMLLNYINDKLGGKDDEALPTDSYEKIWKELRIPSINQVEALPINLFYTEGKTHWYYVLNNKVCLTQMVNKIINESLVNKNIIVVGIPLGGKTVTLMQVACKYSKPVYYVDNLNQAKARMLCNSAIKQGSKKIIIVDNCTDDIIAYKILALCDNISVIGACDDFQYESSKHILEMVDVKRIQIEDISRGEASRIYESIPKDLRCSSFMYKKQDSEKYSILELVSDNVEGYLSKERVKGILEKIHRKDKETFELVLLTTYLSFHKSALNTDVLISYFELHDVGAVREKISRVQSFLSEYDVSLDSDAEDQDYYTLRSNLFITNVHEIARRDYKNEYGYVISKFVENVPMCRIYKNYAFKRKAFDSALFFDLFPENGEKIYRKLYDSEHNAYTLQQLALYMAHKQNYAQAFSYIDEAIHLQPYNFSIKNARAIILFEANKEKDTSEALKVLKDAMNILEECYNSDKRKVYHAQKYAEFAIFLFIKRNDRSYLDQAHIWIKEIIEKDAICSKRTKSLLIKLNNAIGI